MTDAPVASRIAAKPSALTDAEPHSGHPAVGMLEIERNSSSTVDYCSGTLVGSRTVITSAHCLTRSGRRTFWLEQRPHEVAELVVHADWDPDDPSFPNDLGLLKLAEAPSIVPASLSTVAPEVGLQVTLVGYGVTRDGAQDYGVKRIATNTIDQVEDKRFTFSGSGDGSGSTCEGDSGGPALVQLGQRELLMGVNSAGVPPCGTQAVETRVDAYLPWLRQGSDGDLNEASDLDPDAVCRELRTCDTGGCASTRAQPEPTLALVLLIASLAARSRSRVASPRRPIRRRAA